MGRVWGGPDAPGQAATSDAAQHDPTYIHKFPTPVGTLALTLLRSPFHSNSPPSAASTMAGSGSESTAELYWHAFAEEYEIGSCPGPDAAAPSSAALSNGATGSSAAAATASNETVAPLPQVRASLPQCTF